MKWPSWDSGTADTVAVRGSAAWVFLLTFCPVKDAALLPVAALRFRRAPGAWASGSDESDRCDVYYAEERVPDIRCVAGKLMLPVAPGCVQKFTCSSESTEPESILPSYMYQRNLIRRWGRRMGPTTSKDSPLGRVDFRGPGAGHLRKFTNVSRRSPAGSMLVTRHPAGGAD